MKKPCGGGEGNKRAANERAGLPRQRHAELRRKKRCWHFC